MKERQLFFLYFSGFCAPRLPATSPDRGPPGAIRPSQCHVLFADDKTGVPLLLSRRVRSYPCVRVCVYSGPAIAPARHLRYAGACACLRTSASPFPSPLPLGTGPLRKTARGERKHQAHGLMSVRPRYISRLCSAVCGVSLGRGVGTTRLM